jgi:hypothetical protein
VAREINGVLLEVYPSVYGVRSVETVAPFDGAITIPTTAIGIISVWYEDTRNPDQWLPITRYDFTPDASDLGQTLRVVAPRQGIRIRVVFAERPALFDLDGDLDQDFAQVTGLDDRCIDLLSLGVAKRLAPFIDVSRLTAVYAESVDATTARPAGAGGTVARLLTSLFMNRLEVEASVLAREHPIRVHSRR